MSDALKALKELAAVARPGSPTRQAAKAGLEALAAECAAREKAERERDVAIAVGVGRLEGIAAFVDGVSQEKNPHGDLLDDADTLRMARAEGWDAGWRDGQIERERDAAKALSERLICMWCGWEGKRTTPEETTDLLIAHATSCKQRPEVALKAVHDSALASAAVLLHAARKTLEKIALNADEREPGRSMGLMAAETLKALEGGEDVRVWARRFAWQVREIALAYDDAQLERLVDAMLASPPALPDATEALAAFADWIINRSQEVGPPPNAANLARRWLAGGER